MAVGRGSEPTIWQVAQAAEVSIASVSRVLNGLVTNEATARAVRAAVAEVGYLPNSAAKSLKTRRSMQVAFAMEDIGNAAYLAMVRAIQPVLRTSGYRLLLHSTNADVDDELDLVRGLGQQYVDGLIICPLRVTDTLLEALTNAQVPVVVIGQLPQDCPVDNVRVDSRAGAALATQHLIDCGRRRIALVNGPMDTGPGRARYLGYQDALAAAGRREDRDLVALTEFTADAGMKAARTILAHQPAPDAFFAANDVLALGVMHAVREAGLAVPDDIAIVGMDDTELATTVWPPLSSVSLGARERGQLAGELLLARLADPTWPPQLHSVDPELIVRASTANRGETG